MFQSFIRKNRSEYYLVPIYFRGKLHDAPLFLNPFSMFRSFIWNNIIPNYWVVTGLTQTRFVSLQKVNQPPKWMTPRGWKRNPGNLWKGARAAYGTPTEVAEVATCIKWLWVQVQHFTLVFWTVYILRLPSNHFVCIVFFITIFYNIGKHRSGRPLCCKIALLHCSAAFIAVVFTPNSS